MGTILRLAIVLGAGLAPLPPPGAPGSHSAYAARVLAARQAAFREAVGAYDARLHVAPGDDIAAVERCRLLGALVSEEAEEVDDEVATLLSRCNEDLARDFPRSVAAVLYRLEGSWGDEAVELAEGIAANRELVLTNAERARVWKKIADVRFVQQRLAEAASAARRAMELDGDIDLTTVLAAALMEEKKSDEAVRVLLSRIDGGQPAERVAKARALAEAGAYGDAARVLDEVAAASPSVYVDPLLRGEVLERVGRTEEAREAYSGLKAGWNRATVLDRLLAIDLEGRDEQAATRSYRALRDLGWSADPLGHARLALTWRFPGSPWQARDLAGVAGLLAAIALVGLLPLAWIVPVHYFSLWREHAHRRAGDTQAKAVLATPPPSDASSLSGAPPAEASSASGSPPSEATSGSGTSPSDAGLPSGAPPSSGAVSAPLDPAALAADILDPAAVVTTVAAAPSAVAGRVSRAMDPGRWGLGHAWLASAVFLLVQASAWYVLAYPEVHSWFAPRGGDAKPLDTSALAALGLASVAGGLVLLPVLVGWRRLREVFGPGRWSPRQALRAAGSNYGLLLAIGFAYAAIRRMAGGTGVSLTGGEITTSAIVAAMGRAYGAGVVFLVVAVVAPLVEELVFRSVLLGAYSRHLRFRWANLLQALLFTLLHDNLAGLPVIFALGLLSGRLRERSGGLLASVALHAVNNAVFVLVLTRTHAFG